MTKVKLTYFKKSGKYYCESEYMSNQPLCIIRSEVKAFMETGTLPGLTEGCKEFIVLINTPDEEFDVPALVFPIE